MDFYGITIKGDVGIDDNSYDIGDLTHRVKEIHCVTLEGESTSAQWGDLAEKYLCKEDYPVGTVVCGSSDESIDVEASQLDLNPSCIGVISENPGFKLNKGLKGGKYVGLVGRVPVRIVGPVNKGKFIVPTTDGCAREGKDDEIAFKIGVANETNHSPEEKLVKCIIK